MLKLGPFTIYSYGMMLAVSAIVCYFLLIRDAAKEQIPADVISDLMFWVVLAGILGARIFFIFLNLEFFKEFPSEIAMIHHGGLAWQGGLAGGFAAGIIFVKRKKLPILKMLDLSSPYIALGQAIGRVGCFLNGCCYGKEAASGIYFPVHHASLYPTQLYEAVLLFILFLFLKRFQRQPFQPGQVFAFYLFLSSLMRFFVQFYRADHEPVIGFLSIFQVVCIFIFIFAVFFNLYILRKKGP